MRRIRKKSFHCVLSIIAGIILCLLLSNEFGVANVQASTNGHTQADAVAWTNAQVGRGLDYDGVYGNQCVDLIKYYCAYLGVNLGSGNANTYAYKSLPSGWCYTSSPQPGDIAVSTGGQYGHVAIVTERRGSTFVIVEQNYAGRQYCTAREVYYSNSGFNTYIHPDFVVNRDPYGALDAATGGSQTIRVAGWAVDFDDMNYKAPIHVYVGGPAGSGAKCYVITANKYRSDNNIGYHGFDETIEVTETGTVDVYAYAINNVPNTNNPLLGKKTVTITRWPKGSVDAVTGGVQSIHVKGWAIDYDNTNYSVPIHVYVGGPAGSGAKNYIITANKYRSSDYGYHGFDETIKVTETGTKEVYIYAINNTANSHNPLIGRRTVTIQKQPELKPLEISLTNMSKGVYISWPEVSGAVKYRIYKMNSSGNWEKIGNVTSLKFIDTAVKSGDVCTYSVIGVKADKTVTNIYGNGKSITFVIPPVEARVKNKNEGVYVAWKERPGAAKYRIFRKKENGEWKQIKTVSTLNYLDESVVFGKNYTYGVRAMTSGGAFLTELGDGSEITYKVSAPKITLNNTDNGITISWKAMKRADKYRIFVLNSNGNWVKLATVKEGTTYTDKKVKEGKTYTYSVVGMDACGRIMNDNGEGMAITRYSPAISFNLKNVENGVKISWEAYEGAAKYRVFRVNTNGEWAAIGTVKAGSELSYKDTAVVNGKIYSYTVVAMTSGGSPITGYGDGQSITYRKTVNNAEEIEAEIMDEDGNTIVRKVTGDEITEDFVEIHPEETEEVNTEENGEEDSEEAVSEENNEEKSEEAVPEESIEEDSEEVTSEEGKEEVSEEEVVEEIKEEISEETDEELTTEKDAANPVNEDVPEETCEEQTEEISDEVTGEMTTSIDANDDIEAAS